MTRSEFLKVMLIGFWNRNAHWVLIKLGQTTNADILLQILENLQSCKLVVIDAQSFWMPNSILFAKLSRNCLKWIGLVRVLVMFSKIGVSFVQIVRTSLLYLGQWTIWTSLKQFAWVWWISFYRKTIYFATMFLIWRKNGRNILNIVVPILINLFECFSVIKLCIFIDFLIQSQNFSHRLFSKCHFLVLYGQHFAKKISFVSENAIQIHLIAVFYTIFLISYSFDLKKADSSFLM